MGSSIPSTAQQVKLKIINTSDEVNAYNPEVNFFFNLCTNKDPMATTTFQVVEWIGLHVPIIRQAIQFYEDTLNKLTINEGQAREVEKFWLRTLPKDISGRRAAFSTLNSGLDSCWEGAPAQAFKISFTDPVTMITDAVLVGVKAIGELTKKSNDLLVKIRQQIQGLLLKLIERIERSGLGQAIGQWLAALALNPVVAAGIYAFKKMILIIQAVQATMESLQTLYDLLEKARIVLDTVQTYYFELAAAIKEVKKLYHTFINEREKENDQLAKSSSSRTINHQPAHKSPAALPHPQPIPPSAVHEDEKKRSMPRPVNRADFDLAPHEIDIAPHKIPADNEVILEAEHERRSAL